jgi:integrase/recombinase XerD
MKGKELEKIIDSYLADGFIEGNAKSSVENKRGGFNRLLEWLENRDFKPESVKEYTLFLFSKGLQPSSVATDVRKYKAFANWMAKPERHLCPLEWPLLIKVPPVPNKEIDVPSSEMAEKIILTGTNTEKNTPHWTINIEARDALNLMLNTGLRVKEALFLDPKDFYLEKEGQEWFKVASKGKKNGEKDSLPLMSKAVEILKHQRIKDKRNKKSQYFGVSEEALNTMLKRGCERLGVEKITCHKLRHIFATDCARNGMPMYHLQKLMRHSDISITLKYYVHLELEDWRKSLEMYHPLVRKDRNPQQIMEHLRMFVRELKIEEDARFKITNKGDKVFLIETV